MKIKATPRQKATHWIKDNSDAVERYNITSPCFGRALHVYVSLATGLSFYPLTLHCALDVWRAGEKNQNRKQEREQLINISSKAKGKGEKWDSTLPKYASCFGMYSCISDNNFAISCESFVMLQSSSEWKSGLICLHNRSWLITFPRLLGPTADESVCKSVIYSIVFLGHHPNENVRTEGKKFFYYSLLTKVAAHVHGNDFQKVIRPN
jgi:hypothetical protein